MERVRLLPALDCVGAALLRHHNVQLMQEMRVDIENDLRCSENVARVKDPIATDKDVFDFFDFWDFGEFFDFFIDFY